MAENHDAPNADVQSPSMKVYGHRLSQPSRAVEILLRELDIPYAWQDVDFTHGGTHSTAYVENVTPLATIPALVVAPSDNDATRPALRIAESHAIMRYLCRTCRHRELANAWYPSDTDPSRSARIDQWLDWHHNNVRRHDLFHWIMNLHLTLPMLKQEIRTTQLEPRQRGLRHGLALLDAELARGAARHASHPALLGDGLPSIADLAIGCELYQILAVGYRFDGFPDVQRWLDECAAMPQFSLVSAAITQLGKDIGEQDHAYLNLLSAFA